MVEFRDSTLPRAFVACLLAVLVCTLAPPLEAAASARLDRAERRVVKQVNRVRAAHGLPRLRASAGLNRSADYHSRDMLAADFFAHPSSNGQSMAARVSAFRPSNLLGEVLAYLPGKRRRGQARRVVRMWMGSSSHRASLLTPTFRRIGIGRRVGRLGSMRVTVFTADLASRR